MILLSFDTEEFDLPREHGVNYPIEEGMKISIDGTNRVLDILKRTRAKATFFCTGNFAKRAPEVMKRIVDEGHEVACHGVDHWRPKPTDVQESKRILEKITGQKVYGYRQPRMFSVDNGDLVTTEYLYNSSINPAFIPGRYMHLATPRTPFVKEGVLQIPASVTPFVRFPLFWLSFRNLPESLYFSMVRQVLKHDGLFVTYSHPWEFHNLEQYPELKIPYIVRHNSGDVVSNRLERFIRTFKKQGEKFGTYTEYAKTKVQPRKRKKIKLTEKFTSKFTNKKRKS